MNRSFNPDEPELMDRPQPVSPELEEDLLNLVALNRHFGSHRILRRFLAAWFESDRTYRVLDLATGAGDLPRIMVDWARSRRISLQVDAVDANPATLEIATKHSAAYPEIRFIRGDALTYDNRGTYDLVCCSLALHHFSEENATLLLKRCRQLSHRFVLVTDLERGEMTTAGVWFLTQFIFTAPMTRHDGRVSAQRAFSFAEMRLLAETAGWKNFGHSRFLFCRQALWLDERTLAGIPEPAIPMEPGLACPS